MTTPSRLRPTTRRRSRFSLGDEDRRSALIVGGFAAVIGLLVLLLLGAWALNFYQTNIRAVANVGGFEVSPGLVRDRASLELLRLTREEDRVVEARAADELTSSQAATRLQELSTRREELRFTSTESLIDLVYQSQLAAEMDITVSQEEVAAREAREMSGVERRHVRVISIEPETSEGATGPTFGQQRAARERAGQALAQLQQGVPFEQVEAEFGNDDSLAEGGDLGFISRFNPLDFALLNRLFELEPNEHTQVIRGQDGNYYIGQLVEVRPGTEDQVFRSRVQERLSIETYRQFLAWEIAAERLEQRVTAEALEGTHEQVRLAHIRIDNVSPDDEIGGEDQDEVRYSEILFSPGDDPIEAPNLDEDDPAWAEAEQQAQQVADELEAIEDETEQLERFREIAREQSDSEGSAAEGGDAGAVTREIPPSEVADALFDQQHEEETLIGPVRAENGYYLLWFHERLDPPAERLAQLREALDQPTIDWEALVEEYSDDTQSRDEGGEIGWFTRAMLNQIQDEVGDTVFALETGGIADPIGLGNSTHVFRVVERAEREIDADMARFIRGQPGTGTGHFDDWYADRKDQAEADGTIRRTDQEPDTDPGIDFGEEPGEVPGIDEEPGLDEGFGPDEDPAIDDGELP
ncbi:MAG TPA: peptidylprolyl isomerase [Candidatus Limnocylindrales bacterium]|nr:peptidylprolyl isomerase [Candidatus Limnocylindrales bacterium]